MPDSSERPNQSDADPGAAVVSAQALHKSYSRGRSKVRALDGLSVEFDGGLWTAVMGPSGSGKSTLIHCLAGLDTPDSGTVHIGDITVTGLGDGRRTRMRRTRVGFVFQSFNLVPVLSVEENILLPGKLAFRRKPKDQFRDLVDELGISDLLKRRPHELSGGQRQRVAIARALLPSPEVVFADEPTGNLDTETGGSVLKLLRRSVDEYGHTVVMVTHDAGAAARTDRVVMMRDGKLTADLHAPTFDAIQSELRLPA